MKKNKLIGVFILAICCWFINYNKVCAFTIDKTWESKYIDNDYDMEKYNDGYYLYGAIPYGEGFCEYLNEIETCFNSSEVEGKYFIEILDKEKNVKLKRILNDFVAVQNIKRYNDDLYVIVGQYDDEYYSPIIAFLDNDGNIIKKTFVDDSEIDFYSAYLYDLSFLSNGNIIVIGDTYKTDDSRDPSALLLQIYDNNLNYIKTVDFEYINLAYTEIKSNLIVDNNDNFYLVKETRYRKQYPGTLYYKYDLKKYDKNGNLVFSKILCDKGTDSLSWFELAITNENELLLVGSQSNDGKLNAIFNKYDLDGNIIFSNINNESEMTYYNKVIENGNEYLLMLTRINSATDKYEYELVGFNKNGEEILRNNFNLDSISEYDYYISDFKKVDNNKYIISTSYWSEEGNYVNYIFEVSLYNDLTLEKPMGGNLMLSKNKVAYGDTVKVTATPDDEHILDYYLVDGEKTTKNTFVVRKDMNISAVFKEKYSYLLKSQSESILTNKDIIITIDGNYNKFKDLFINNVKVDKKYYSVKEGSTIITISKNYLNTLNVGVNNVKVLYTNDKEVNTTLKVNKYNVTINSGIENGTVSPSINRGNLGDIVKLDIKANDGYEVDKILVNGIKINDTKFELEKDSEIEVKFKKINTKIEDIENPNTYDGGIFKYVLLIVISIIGCLTSLIVIKKEKIKMQ